MTVSMYQPGGARLGFEVTFIDTAPLVTVNGRSTSRWLGSELWVTAAGRSRAAETIVLLTVYGLAWIRRSSWCCAPT